MVPYLPAVKTPLVGHDHNIPAIGNVETVAVELFAYRLVRIGIDYILYLSGLYLFPRVSEGFEIDFPPFKARRTISRSCLRPSTACPRRQIQASQSSP